MEMWEVSLAWRQLNNLTKRFAWGNGSRRKLHMDWGPGLWLGASAKCQVPENLSTLKIQLIRLILSALFYLKLGPYQYIYFFNLYELTYSPYKTVWQISKLTLKACTIRFNALKYIFIFQLFLMSFDAIKR